MRRQQDSYDANGNLTYESTARKKADGHYEHAGMERKLLWDEENRLTALSENGYVSHYWYDADGHRTMKTHGPSATTYVNAAEQTGGMTDTYGYTLYPSPFFVWSEDSVYSKHVFVGNERVVSRLGNVHNFDFNPWEQEKAGEETSSIVIDYAQKYAGQTASLADSYAELGVPYHGTDYSDMAGGGKNFSGGTTADKLQFYYHNDHLASTGIVTNPDGDVTQRVEYLPYGEVFYEEQNQIEERGLLWNTTYKFNGKELDEETGLLYYGARYFDPKRVFWYSTDELEKNNPYVSTYTYCDDNPIVFYEQEGREKIIALNYRSGQNAESNRIIVKAVQNFQDNPHTINIWAHGNEKSMTVYYKNTGRSEIIRDSKSFIKLLKTNSKVWNNSKDGKNVTIVLHSCSTGAILKNGDGLAQSLSKDIPNAIIIAPDHTVKVNSSSGERGVFFNDTRMEEEMGQWNQFENGKLTKIFPGDAKVGSSDYIQ